VLAANLGLTAEPSLYLAGLNAGTNYAVAGARARGVDVIDLRSQINAFLSGVGGSVPDQALYMVFIGGNDLRDARVENNPVNVLQIINAAVNGIDEVIRSLLDSGAQSILVVNSPDISVVPETVAIAKATNLRKFIRITRRKTQLFNHRLAQKLAKIEQDFDIDLVDFDLFSFSQSVIKNQSALGFTNVLEGCFSSLTFTFNPDCDNGTNFDKFIFFDEFHTTVRVNERTGRAFYALVPEPTAKSDSLE
jgi:phospholipase/lecithinase/hemolysin